MGPDQFLELLYALGVGALIGLEREHKHADEKQTPDGRHPDYLGVRTFSIFSLLGVTAALLGDRFPIVPPLVLASVALLVVAMYLRSAGGEGITTEVAAIGTCALGMLTHVSRTAAVTVAILVAVLLVAKDPIHSAVRKMRRVELTATLQLLIVIAVVLPLLPERAVDPWGAVSPRKVWYLVILITGISYLGYFLIRIFGARRGSGLTGLLGGLASSTAVTAAMANQVRATPELLVPSLLAVLLANGVMPLRMLVILEVIDPALARRSAPALAVMSGVLLVVALVVRATSRRRREGADKGAPPALSNPFAIGPALKLGILFTAMLLITHVAQQQFGNRGIYVAAGLTGAFDVTPVIIAVAKLTKERAFGLDAGVLAVVLAAVANQVFKAAIAVYSGGLKFGRLVVAAFALMVTAGLTVALLLRLSA